MPKTDFNLFTNKKDLEVQRPLTNKMDKDEFLVVVFLINTIINPPHCQSIFKLIKFLGSLIVNLSFYYCAKCSHKWEQKHSNNCWQIFSGTQQICCAAR